MKKLNQHLILAAATMLMASSAFAQGVAPAGPGPQPTNTYGGPAVRSLSAPTNSNAVPGGVTTAGPNGNNTKGGYSPTYSDYSQDSYVNQTGSGNYATVDQVNTGGANNAGSTAVIYQTGDNNKVSQMQSSAGDSRYAGQPAARNYVRSEQNGSGNEVVQSQSGGIVNRATVVQGGNSNIPGGVGGTVTNNYAKQTQMADGSGMSSGNQAEIRQTRYTVAGGGSGNYAEQVQSGGANKAQLLQEATNSYAKQTQSGNGNDYSTGNSARIQQGDPGTKNSAEQTQTGLRNSADIGQGLGGTTNSSYAMQTQTGNDNQAQINQFGSSNNYAEQMQMGNSNYSKMSQSNVTSAAYSTQTGNSNTSMVNQH